MTARKKPVAEAEITVEDWPASEGQEEIVVSELGSAEADGERHVGAVHTAPEPKRRGRTPSTLAPLARALERAQDKVVKTKTIADRAQAAVDGHADAVKELEEARAAFNEAVSNLTGQ